MNDIFLGLHTRHLGRGTRQLTNPFTGAPVTVHIDEGMTDDEVSASAAVFGEAGASEPDPEGYRRVDFRSGSVAFVYQDRIGAEINVNGGFAFDVADFIFRLAIASGMLVTSTTDPDIVAVLPGQRGPDVENRWPQASHVASASDLKRWVNERFVVERGTSPLS